MSKIALRISAVLRCVTQPFLNGLRKMYRQLQCCLSTAEQRQASLFNAFNIQIKRQAFQCDSEEQIDLNEVLQNETQHLITRFLSTQLP